MRIVFVLRHTAFLRLFESTIAELGRRGHEVRIVFSEKGPRDSDREHSVALERMLAYENVSASDWEPDLRKRRATADTTVAMRQWQDYLRYFEPSFEGTPKLRQRVEEKLPPRVRELSDALVANPELAHLVRIALALGERALVEPPEHARELLERERPDLVVTTLLVGRSVRQIEIARAARAAGVPVAYACASWDNLVTSGVMHAFPDVMAVWNEAQRREAVELHGMREDAVLVTGAPVYDIWFDARPTATREAWCAEIGLDPARPYLLYTCSSRFITEDESGYVAKWIEGVRASGLPELRDVQVLVRRHPQHPMDATRLQQMEGVSVYPAFAEAPMDEPSRARYVNSIHHAAAVSGVNTSALIESAILGRGIHVYLSKRYRTTQAGTLHFRHLLEAGGGLLQATASLEEHHAGLAAAVSGEDAEATAARARGFLGAFIRPAGLDQPAAPLLADALERVPEMARARNGADPYGIGLAADELRELVKGLV